MKTSVFFRFGSVLFPVVLVCAVASASQTWVQWNGNGHWYKVVVVPSGVGWKEADVVARQQGGYLATVTSTGENTFVVNLINSGTYWSTNGPHHVGPWIGLVQPPGSQEPGGGWSWSNGEASGYTNWYPGQPDNANNNEDRGQYYWRDGNTTPGWNDAPEGSLVRNTPQAVSLVVETPYAPPTWVQWGGNGHWYKAVAVPQGISWEDAQAEAAMEGGYLATPTSTNENNFVFGLLSDARFKRLDVSGQSFICPWVGLWQIDNAAEPAGDYLWSSAEASSFRNWAAGEPNNFLGIEDYATYRHPVGNASPIWNDFPNAGYPLEWVPGFVVESATAPVASAYTILDIGVPSGFNKSRAGRINDSGFIAGQVGETLTTGRGFVWSEGTGFRLLDGTGTYPFSGALDISGVGHTGGYMYNATFQVATGWPQNSSSPQPAAVGLFGGINDNFRVSGSWLVGQDYRAWYWVQQFGAVPVDGPAGYQQYVVAAQMSNTNSFVGTAWDLNPANANARSRGAMWDGNGAVTNMGVLSGDTMSGANDINSSNVAVGYSGTSSLRKPMRFTTGGGMQAIPLPQGFDRGEAIEISNAGHVLGIAGRTGGGEEFVLWRPDNTMLVLDDVIGNLSGWSILSVSGVNSGGQVSGTGLHNGQQRGFLLNPGSPGVVPVVPVPTKVQMFRGNLVGGNLESLFRIDQNYLTTLKGIVVSQTESPITVILYGILPYMTASNLSVELRGRANTVGLTMKTEAYNYSAQTWVQIDQRAAPTADTTIVAPVTGPQDFVNHDTREVKIRVSLRQTGPTSNPNWQFLFDSLNWTSVP